MAGDGTAPPGPFGFQEHLLTTSSDVVPDECVERLRAFCDAEEAVETAYICAVERQRDEAAWKALSFAVKLTSPVDGPDDSRAASLGLATRLKGLHPELMRELGFGVLADRAVPAWETFALRIFAR
jgi:hypothetical protein